MPVIVVIELVRNLIRPLTLSVRHIQPEWYFLFAYAILRSISISNNQFKWYFQEVINLPKSILDFTLKFGCRHTLKKRLVRWGGSCSQALTNCPKKNYTSRILAVRTRYCWFLTLSLSYQVICFHFMSNVTWFIFKLKRWICSLDLILRRKKYGEDLDSKIRTFFPSVQR